MKILFLENKRQAITVLFVLLSVLLAGFAGAPEQAEPERPNILLISIDDLNDWVGHLGGHPQAKTPYMDRLADRGVSFTNAHVQSPVCNPSRTSMLMGLRPSTTGIYSLKTWFRDLPKYNDWTTLPQYFQEHGYVTLTTGKVYHGGYPPKRGRRDGVEFSKWGYSGNTGPYPDEPFVSWTGHPLVDWGVYPDGVVPEDRKVTAWAMKQLRDPPEEKPFFLSVGLRSPHVPLYATKRWFDLYPPEKLKLPKVRENDRVDVPRFAWYLHWNLPEPRLARVKKHDEWKQKVRAYLATVSYTDMLVGRLMKTLQQEGLRENTIIVLASDHGYHLRSKGITGKNTLWHESTRVPFLFAGPGITDPGNRSDEAVEVLDVYPTLIDLAGLPERDGLDGQSLVPLLENTERDRNAPAISTHGPNNHVVVTEKWRYIRYANGAEELYNRNEDPYEWHNLAGKPTYDSVKEKLARHLPENDAPPATDDTTRLIEMVDGVPHWEGKPIDPDDPVPRKYHKNGDW